jgi:hypothetical protein
MTDGDEEEIPDEVRIAIPDVPGDLYERMTEAVDFFDESRYYSKKHYGLRCMMAGVNWLESQKETIMETRDDRERIREVMYDRPPLKQDEKPEDKPKDRDIQVQQGLLQEVGRLGTQVKELQKKLYDDDVLEQQEKVENLRDELRQANKDEDYERREELLEELDEARDHLDELKEEAQDDSDQD